MYIYFILFMIITVLRVVCKKNKKIFCILVGFFLWLLLALRSIEVGLYDTKAVYYREFSLLLNMSFHQILTYEWMQYKGFYFIMKFLSLIIENYQFIIAVLAIPYVYSTMKFIENKSLSPFFSTIIYISLYYMYATFLLKQVIAIGILLFSIKQIENRNFFKFALIVIFASFFHQTALIFLIAYPFALFNKFSSKNYIYIVIAIFLSQISNIFILDILKQSDKISFLIEHNIYSVDSEVSMFGLVITVAILMYGHFYRNKAIKDNKYDYNWDIYLNISTLGSMLFACSNVVAEFYRVALYFSIVNIIIMPNFITKEKDKGLRQFELFIFVIIFITYFFTRTINNVNANPYLFFWN